MSKLGCLDLPRRACREGRFATTVFISFPLQMGYIVALVYRGIDLACVPTEPLLPP